MKGGSRIGNLISASPPKMNNELAEKLAEWRGFIHLPYKVMPNMMKLQDDCWAEPTYTTQVTNHWSFDPPLFPQSLDACFKWLVPEHISEITFMYASNCVSCDIEDLEGNFFEGHVNVESIEEAWIKSALVLCLAISKLIGDKYEKDKITHKG